MNDVKRIYFVRHGSPERLPGQYLGMVESPLTDQGKNEAAKTGRWFGEQGFAGPVYSSPLSRAYDTAQIIVDEVSRRNASYKPAIKIVDKLAECDFGLFDGKVSTEFQKEYPKEFSTWLSDPFNNSFPKGESFADCGKRFCKAVNQILEENKESDDDILIAAHMCVIQSYLIVTGLDEFSRKFVDNPLPCASVTSVAYSGDGKMAVELFGWLPEQ